MNSPEQPTGSGFEPLDLGKRPLFTFGREERQLCAFAFQLMLQSTANLERFLSMVNRELDSAQRLSLDHLDRAEVYVEFAALRDYWFEIGRNNPAKREFVLSLFARIPTLANLAKAQFPDPLTEWNATFGGARGGKIRRDVIYPGAWTLSALEVVASTHGLDAEGFRDLCRLKWSFNIKPDLVVLLPAGQAVCVEAKLESKEDLYPSNKGDCEIFDRVIGSHSRVGQVELQQFMFRYLLERPCTAVVLSKPSVERRRPSTREEAVVTLNWGKFFSSMDRSLMHPFVTRFLSGNKHLAESRGTATQPAKPARAKLPPGFLPMEWPEGETPPASDEDLYDLDEDETWFFESVRKIQELERRDEAGGP